MHSFKNRNIGVFFRDNGFDFVDKGRHVGFFFLADLLYLELQQDKSTLARELGIFLFSELLTKLSKFGCQVFRGQKLQLS